jgi:hypothetical protein
MRDGIERLVLNDREVGPRNELNEIESGFIVYFI